MKHIKRAIPIVLALVMAFALSVSAWAAAADDDATITTSDSNITVNYHFSHNGDSGSASPSIINPSSLSDILTALKSYDEANTYSQNAYVKSIIIGSSSDAPVEISSTYDSVLGDGSTKKVVVTHNGTGMLTITASGDNLSKITVGTGATVTIDKSGGSYTVVGDGGTLIVNHANDVNATGNFANITVNDGALDLGKSKSSSNTSGTETYISGTVTLANGAKAYVYNPDGTCTVSGTNAKLEVVSTTSAGGVGNVSVKASGTFNEVTVQSGTLELNNKASQLVPELIGGKLTLVSGDTTTAVRMYNTSNYTSGELVVNNGQSVTVKKEASSEILTVSGAATVAKTGTDSKPVYTVSGAASGLTVKSGDVSVTGTVSGTINYTGGNLTIAGNNNGSAYAVSGNVSSGATNDTLTVNSTSAKVNAYGDFNKITVTKGDLRYGTADGTEPFPIKGTLQMNGGTVTLFQSASITDATTSPAVTNTGTVAFGRGDLGITATVGSKVTVIGAGASNNLLVTKATAEDEKAASAYGTFNSITVNGGELNWGYDGTEAKTVSSEKMTINTSEDAAGKLNLYQNATITGGNKGEIVFADGNAKLTATIGADATGTFTVIGAGEGNSLVVESGDQGTVYAIGEFNAITMGSGGVSGRTMHLGYTLSGDDETHTTTTVYGGLTANAGNVFVKGAKGATEEADKPVIITKLRDELLTVGGNGHVTLDDCVTVGGGEYVYDVTGAKVSTGGTLTMSGSSKIDLKANKSAIALKGLHNAGGTITLNNTNIDLTGAMSDGIAIHNESGKLTVYAGTDDVTTKTAPTEHIVSVTTAKGTALKIDAGTVNVYGGYKAALFKTGNGTALSVADATNVNLYCGEFVGTTKVEDSVFAGAIPGENYYIDTDGTESGAQHQTVADAVWAIQYFMGEATETTLATSAQYNSTTKTYTMPISINLDAYVYGKDHGTLENDSSKSTGKNANRTIALATGEVSSRTLNLNGMTLTGAKDVDVITGGGSNTELTVVDTSSGGTGTITATGTAKAINLTGGNVEVNATTAQIVIVGKPETADAIVTKGGVTITNAYAGKAATYGTINVNNCAVLIDGNIEAKSTDEGEAVTINNNANGLVAVTNSITASSDVNINNGKKPESESDTLNSGTVVVGNDVKADTDVIIKNYSTGSAFTYGENNVPSCAVFVFDDVTAENKAVTIQNYVDGLVGVGGKISATKENVGKVKIFNLANGAISVNAYDKDAGDGITAASDVLILNMMLPEGMPLPGVNDEVASTTGTIMVGKLNATTGAITGGAITGGTVAIGNNSASENAVVTGNVTASKDRVSIANFAVAPGKITVDGTITGKANITEESVASAVEILNGGTGAIEVKKNVTSAAGDVTITNGTAGGNAETGTIKTGDVTGATVAITNHSAPMAAEDATAPNAIETGNVTASSKVDVDNNANGTIETGAITASGAVDVDNNANGKIEVTGAITASGNVDVDNNATGTIKLAAVNATDTATIDVDNNANGKIETGAIGGNGSGNLTVNNNKVDAAGNYAGTITIASIARTNGNVTIQNGNNEGSSTYTGTIKVGTYTYANENDKVGTFNPGTVSGTAVAITNYSAPAAEGATAPNAIEVGSVTAATNNVAINNSSAGTIKVAGTVEGKAKNSAENAVAISNVSAGKIEITGDVKTTTDSADSVSIANSDNGTVTVGGAVTAGGTTTYGDVTITNGDNDETAETGKVAVTGAVTGKTVAITNYSTDANAVKTGKVTANGETGAAETVYGVKVLNNAAAGATGTITIDADEAPAILSKGGNVFVTNEANSTLTVKGITAYDGTSTYKNVTITNGKVDTDVETGAIAITEAITGAAVNVTNYASVKTEDNAPVDGTGTITITATGAESKAINATGAVDVQNMSNGEIEITGTTKTGDEGTDTTAIETTGASASVSITNGTATGTETITYAGTGSVTVNGVIKTTTSTAAVTLTNNSAPNTETNKGGEISTGAIEATGATTIDNKANGTITTEAITGTGTATVAITNGTDNTNKGMVKTGNIVTDGANVTITNKSTLYKAATDGAAEVDAIQVGTITTTKTGGAAGAVSITNSGDGKVVSAAITTKGADGTDSTVQNAGMVTLTNEANGSINTGLISAKGGTKGTSGNDGASGAVTITNGTESVEAKTGSVAVGGAVDGAKATITNRSSKDITMGKLTAVTADADDSVITSNSTGKIAIAGIDYSGAGDLSINKVGEGSVEITNTNGHGVNFTSTGKLTINGATITATNGDGVHFKNATGTLDIDAGTINGTGTYEVPAAEEGGEPETKNAYGLNVVSANTVNLEGTATYNSVTTERASVYGTVTSGTYTTGLLDATHDWVKYSNNDTQYLSRTQGNYLNDTADGLRQTWPAETDYLYKVRSVGALGSLTAAAVTVTQGTDVAVSFTQAFTGALDGEPQSVTNPYIVANNDSDTETDKVTVKSGATDWTTKGRIYAASDAATGTPAGAITFTDAYGKTTDAVTITVNARSVTPSPSPAPAAPATPTVSLSGDDNSVSIGVTTKDGVATMAEPKAADLEKVIGAGVETGEVVINMSSLNSSIDTAAIPTKTFDAIEAAVTDASNDADELTIKLPASSVTFNAAALDAIAEQATGSSISLEVSKDTVSKLATAQQNAVKALDVQDVYSITLTSGGKTISDFNGGSATVSVNYTLKAGQNAKGIVVWYVANDGTLTEVPATFSAGKVTFTVSHFSNYVIAYDAERAAACPQDSTCPIAAFSDADEKAWYHDGVHWALENGAMSGMGNGTFAPNGTTTRAMVAQILWNLEGKPAYVGMSEYTDVDNDDWFGPAVRWASAEGIVTGYDGKFAPNDPVTREQLATMLYRYAQYKNIDVSVGEDTNILSYEDAFNVNTWAMAAMQWACGAGVMNGVAANGTMYLQPQNDATRAVVATMIARFCTEVAK